MYCPNCGLANEAGAKFCANCGTTLAGVPPAGGAPSSPGESPLPYAQPGAYQAPNSTGMANASGGSIAKKIGIGCLVALFIFFFVGLSCTRSCFRHRRAYVTHYF